MNATIKNQNSLLGAVAVAAACASLNCGSGHPTVYVPDNLCKTSYGSACEQSCSSTDSCALGLHCAAGRCTAECTPTTGCATGQICSLAGACMAAEDGMSGTPCTPDAECPAGFACSSWHCVPATTGCSGDLCALHLTATDAGGKLDATFAGEACIDIHPGFEKRTPTIVMLVDQSSTMNQHYPSATSPGTRWSILRDTLLSKSSGIVYTLQSEIRFGLTTYTGLKQTGTCPLLTKVSPALDNYEAIYETYFATQPMEDTPTAAAVRATTADLVARDESDPKYIILVTDGLPDTCSDPDPNSGEAQEAANLEAVRSVKEAYAAHIGLFVMGVSSEIGADNLRQLANAGAGLDPATPAPDAASYWIAAESQEDLGDQLGTILGTVRSCVFMLHGTVEAGYESQGRVILNGEPLSYADPNGWKLVSASQLELLGSACNTVKTEGQSLSIEFPCKAFTAVN